jgi:3-methyladenine DNA glycosylase AlkD
MFGVKVADFKVIAKRIKSDQALACGLNETSFYDAMYLAGLVANGKLMTKKQLDDWAKSA